MMRACAGAVLMHGMGMWTAQRVGRRANRRRVPVLSKLVTKHDAEGGAVRYVSSQMRYRFLLFPKLPPWADAA